MNTEANVLSRLDTLVRLVAAAICAGRPQKESVRILARAGLQPKDIADLLGTTPNTVSVALYEMRKAKKPKKKTKAAAGALVAPEASDSDTDL
jgi:hypothetical protein